MSEKECKCQNEACNGDCENCEVNECDHNCEGCESGCSGDCSSCGSSCSHHMSKEEMIKPQNKYSNVKHVIAIMSGKGGVGKSMVTSLLASKMNKLGYKVGILDADVTGPSIPKVFDVKGPCEANHECIFPKLSKKGVKIISANLLLDNESEPIIWRGPVIANLVEQFWTQVGWDDVDYLFVDMPPGTGDVPLTVCQSLPIEGIIIVTSPQDLVSMIVEKAVKMASKMDIKVLGMIENMSYFICPNCEEKHYIYGPSHVEEVAYSYGINTVCKMPIEPSIASYADEGLIEEYDEQNLNPLTNILEKL